MSNPSARTPLSLAVLLSFAVFVGGVIAGSVGGLACDENIHPGTTRETVCSYAGTGSSLVLLAIVPPLVMLIIGLAAPRRVAGLSAASILLAETILVVVVLKTAT